MSEEGRAGARTRLAQRLGKLTEHEAAYICTLDVEIVQYWTSQLDNNREVVLTGRQRQHYLGRHPETAVWELYLAEVISEPDEIHRNRDDPARAIFYRRLDQWHYLRVAVLMQTRPGKRKHSILSYRLAKEREVASGRARRVWRRE